MDALVNGFPDTPIISALVQIFRVFAQSTGAWFWFAQAPSDRNLSDLPTRGVDLPLPAKYYSDFEILEILGTWVTLHRKKEEFPFS